MSRRPEHLGKRVDFSAHTKKLAEMPCANPDCDRAGKIHAGADVVCNKHYQRWLKGKDHMCADPARYVVCTIQECEKPVRSAYSKYCEMHYGRLRRGVSLKSKTDSISQCLHCGADVPEKSFKYCSERCSYRHDYNVLEKRLKRWNTSHKMRAKAAGCEYEDVDIMAMFEEANWTCHICGESIDKEIRWPDKNCASLDHNIAIKSGGGHTKENCRPSHARCNLKKAYEHDIPNAAKVKRMSGETGQQARRKKNGSKFAKPAGYVSSLNSQHPNYKKPKWQKRIKA